MSQTVIGIFNNASDAHDAIRKIEASGISTKNVDFSSGGTQNASTGSSLSSTESSLSSTDSSFSSTNSSDDHESGISKFFKNLFGSDNDESDRYSKVAGQRAVVTVHARTAEEAELAADIMDDNGAIDVNDSYGQYSGNTSDYGTASMHATTDLDTNLTDQTTGESKSIPIIEETLEIGKKEIVTGGVRLRSRIVEKPVEESLRLREEYVRVERNQVDRKATDADLNNFQEGTIEVVERAEIPVVAKEARVVEEVSLGKEVDHREEVISDTVRKTEVDVERFDADQKKGNTL